MLELGGVATSVATPLLHKLNICLKLSEISETTNRGGFNQSLRGINENPAISDGLIQSRGDSI